MSEITTKQLGDAGEYFALSQFGFADKPGVKMPDNWPEYDLIIRCNGENRTVSVKTRSETDKSSDSSHFRFNVQDKCDYLVFIFKAKTGSVRAWVVPFVVASEHEETMKSGDGSRRIRLGDLKDGPLSKYENNWSLAV